MNPHTNTRARKIVLLTAGFVLLILVVLMTVVYRSHTAGLTYVPLFEQGIQERPEKDEFITSVVYNEPFSEERVRLTDSPPTNQDVLMASAIGAKDAINNLSKSLFGTTLFSAQFEKFVPAAVPFAPLKATAGEATLNISPATVIGESEDQRALGYTGQRKMVIDNEGSVTVAYRQKYDGYYQIFKSELRNINDEYVTMIPTEPLSERTLGITQRVPALTIDGRGLIHVVWYGSDDKEYPQRRQIMHTTSKGSKNFWQRNELVSYVEGYGREFERWQEHPSITLGDYDDLYVVWEGKDEEHENQQVKLSASYNGGDDWSEWRNIHPNPEHTYSRPTIVSTTRNILYLFAYSSDGSRSNSNQIQYSYSIDNGFTWTDWKITSADVHDARHITATVVDDTPVIVYRTPQTENGPAQLVYQTVSGEQVSEPVVFHPSENYQLFPSVTAIDGTRDFCVGWIEEDTQSDFPNDAPSDGDIYFGCRTLGGPEESVYNLTPKGSHLYPVLPEVAHRDFVPIAYYDDESQKIKLQIINLLTRSTN